MEALTSVIDRKWRITIPSKVQKQIGIKSGDKVIFAITKNAEVLMKPANRILPKLLTKLRQIPSN